MAEWIVVSNREPYEHHRVGDHLAWRRTDGGLTSALDTMLRRHGGTWVAWGSGGADAETANRQSVIDVPPDQPAYRLKRVWLT